jgi:hypothetical protein
MSTRRGSSRGGWRNGGRPFGSFGKVRGFERYAWKPASALLSEDYLLRNLSIWRVVLVAQMSRTRPNLSVMFVGGWKWKKTVLGHLRSNFFIERRQ